MFTIRPAVRDLVDQRVGVSKTHTGRRASPRLYTWIMTAPEWIPYASLSLSGAAVLFTSATYAFRQRPRLKINVFIHRYDEKKPLRVKISNRGQVSAEVSTIFFIMPNRFSPYPIYLERSGLGERSLPTKIEPLTESSEWKFDPLLVLRRHQEQICSEKAAFEDAVRPRWGSLARPYQVYARVAGGKIIRSGRISYLKKIAKRYPDFALSRSSSGNVPTQ